MSDAHPDASAPGRFTFPGPSISVNRMGYGAMQLAGPHVFGEPEDPDEARAALGEALALGVDRIDTSDFYGPHVANRLIREALHPHPGALTLGTRIGACRDDEGGRLFQRDAGFLRRSVEENLTNLGLERMAIVNLRPSGPQDDIEAPMRAMREEGLLVHIGIGTVDDAQLRAARDIAPVVCVQNRYDLVHRADDAMTDALAAATSSGLRPPPFPARSTPCRSATGPASPNLPARPGPRPRSKQMRAGKVLFRCHAFEGAGAISTSSVA